jgi:uncharacterized protein (TIGR04222 family)
MTAQQADLYRRLMAFDIDGPNAVALPFAARLARENGWSRVYAERVVNEYKRYIFLAVTAGRPMTPSEEVDQAWHLHLAYSKSYWTQMCGNLLKTPLHHNPTEGGSNEHDKHLRQYDDTLRQYRETFGKDAPVDIWPDAATRFGPKAEGVRVVTHDHWVIPKRPVFRAGLAAAAAVAMTVSVGCAGGMNPFELEGMKYLGFLIPTMIAAIVLGNIYWMFVRGQNPDANADEPDLTWEQAAYLAGQKNRLATAAITRLVDRQYAALDGANTDRLIRKSGAGEPDSPVERAILKALPLDRSDKGSLSRLADKAEGAFAEEIHRLEEVGYLLTKAKAKSVAILGASPLILVILTLGLPRLVLGIQNGKPAIFLIITLIAASVIAFMMTFAQLLRTRKGEAALKRLQAANAKLKTGSAWKDAPPRGIPPEATAAMAVALFGTVVLAGSPLDRLKEWYPRQTTDGSGSGCSTGCGTSGGGGDGGGGDGGGSGCGGCGGGGGD